MTTTPSHEGIDRVELPGGWYLTHNGPSCNRRYWLNHPERGSVFHIDVGCYLSEFLEFAAALQARAPEVEALRELSEKATPGEWSFDDRCVLGINTNAAIASSLDVIASTTYSDRDHREDQSNLKFIVAAINHVRKALAQPPAPAPQGDGWLAIDLADKDIAAVHVLGDLTIRNSDRYWVREPGREPYEAWWTDHRGGYWWDIENEDPCDPTEFLPHPLDRARFTPAPPSDRAAQGGKNAE